jgi:hypothetical protein
MKLWWKKNNDHSSKDHLEYFWRGRRNDTCPTAYIAIQRVSDRPTEITKALSRCRRTRKLVFSKLVMSTASGGLDADTKAMAIIWDELLPLDGKNRPTHFVEIGVWNDLKLPRSPFLRTAICLTNSTRDLSYCAGEIGGFLRWGLLLWDACDFVGAADSPESSGHLWLYQCLFAQWKKRLRIDPKRDNAAMGYAV